MGKVRIAYLDIVRVLACVMVVMMHSPMPTEKAISMVALGMGYITAPCIGLFFMVSGALLLPVNGDAIAFLKRRLGKVLIPTIVWTLFYIGVNCFYEQTIDFNAIAQQILSMPFSAQGNGVLWFMYVLIGLYLIAPVISPWLEICKRSTLELYLCIWGVTMCFPLIENVLSVNTEITGLFYYLSGYIGYFILGYYLKRYGGELHLKLISGLFAISLLVPVGCYFYGLEVDFYRVFWYLSIFVAIMCVFWFRWIQSLFENRCSIGNTISFISNISFGIYLVHIFLMRRFIWSWEFIKSIENYAIQTLTVFICTFLLSSLICYLFALLPFGDYLIGYRLKKKL